MKSTITLFYKSLINKEKNFVLDDGNGNSRLENYLSTLQKVVINDFQYVKIQLSLAIKIDMNQSNLEMIDSKDLNYAKIQNGIERPYYYFVVSKIWKSKDTIELVLAMDTLNCFKFNEDYVINEKTLTKRMHRDRFEKVVSGVTKVVLDYSLADPLFEGLTQNTSLPYQLEVYKSGDVLVRVIECDGIYKPSQHIIELTNISKQDAKFLEEYPHPYYDHIDFIDSNLGDAQIFAIPKYAFSYDYTNAIIKKIDLKSEDISCPVYKKNEEELRELQGAFNNSWVLYYKNQTQQDDSPIDCYLTSDEEMTFLTETGSNTIDVSDITSGKVLMLTPVVSGDISFSVDGVRYRCYEQPNFQGNASGYYCIGLENQSGVLVFRRYVYVFNGATCVLDSRYTIEIINPTTVVVETSIDEMSGVEITPPPLNSYYPISTPNSIFNPANINKTITLAPLTERTLYASSTIDKTLNENVKIINLPYCPSTLTEDSGKYVIEDLWKYDSTYHFFKLDDFSRRFSNSIISNVDNVLNYFNTAFSVNLSGVRTLKDSKLYHSDYFRPKFVYDSFSRIFSLEQINYEKSLDAMSQTSKFEFTFVMSRNIVSKFLFKFNFVYEHSNEDYPNVVAVARNNEEVLYNSSYLNYIRTGYNYDLKSKERQETAGAIGIGLNVAGLIASIGLSFVPGGQAIGIAGAVGAGLGLAGQLVNYAKTTAQNEENIQRKLAETQRQAVSVLNADDYDLLYEYTRNKAKLCLYEVSPKMKEVLDDLFYYAGYIVNEQMIPEISSRYWFNFVQATLVINDSSNLTSEIEDDIKEKFEQGVTFLHYHNKFDFKQEMENWETSLL